MSSLFDVYDPYTFYMNLSLNWACILFILAFSFSNFWCLSSPYLLILYNQSCFLFSEFSLFFKFNVLKSLISLFVILFMYFVFVNLFGLVPYVFSVSSHFVFCLSFSFPFWLGVMIMGWTNLTNQMFSHLIPIGTPLGLVSFMVLIETISQLIRPWSLAIRLMANMISGHLLMSLMGGMKVAFYNKIVVSILHLVFFSFEIFVCFIQAYVFCALLILYYSEV